MTDTSTTLTRQQASDAVTGFGLTGRRRPELLFASAKDSRAAIVSVIDGLEQLSDRLDRGDREYVQSFLRTARSVRDEIRLVGPQLYLGVIWLGGRRIGWFTLREPTARRGRRR